jgi:hypothetical protein
LNLTFSDGPRLADEVVSRKREPDRHLLGGGLGLGGPLRRGGQVLAELEVVVEELGLRPPSRLANKRFRLAEKRISI